MVKVIQNTNNHSVAQIKIKPNPVKVIKIPAATEGNLKVCIISYKFLTCVYNLDHYIST